MKKTKKITISGDEGIEIIKKLDQMVVSFDKIKSHFGLNPDTEKENETIANFVIENQVAIQLAYIRGLLSSKFDLEVGADDMDEIERACQHNNYWKPKGNSEEILPENPNWHEENVLTLKTAIINDFEFLFHYMQKKKQHIYGFALILDDDVLTAYSVVSTTESLKKIHKNREWNAEEWCLGIEEEDVAFGLNKFTDILINYYDESIAPLFQKGFDYEPIRQKSLQLYTIAMQLAKEEIIQKYGDEIQEIAFFLTIPGEPEITKNSAIAINQPASQKVNELIESLYI
ncbi:DUF4303 domain-containing protein [Sphingobacterium bovistauri]|uniref:DUF4303 domain-containing protein n=1 Tax=Sphingobacterium bovistauri TaxID=2781959 RepID=A0ABS7Z4W1_9SPHI|nr:DUF4303 domain-containing protein [Sphingobacterium bovistauri]MCA5005235.1 DUF4303 domain-containing protein [Sphingobacterium bovistauri]